MSVFDNLPGLPPSTVYHVAGTTAAGPVGEGVRVRGIDEYTKVFGERTAESAVLHDDLTVYFSEGGVEAMVARVTGPALSDYLTALELSAEGTRGGCVAVPELDAATIGPALIIHAARFSQIALLAPAATATAADAGVLAASLGAVEGADCAGLFWPWVVAPGERGRGQTVSPVGYVAAARARAHLRGGFWRHPAGEPSASYRLRGLAQPSSRKDAFLQGKDLVSGLAPHRYGVQLYGWWSLGTDRANFPHLTTRDLLNNIAAELDRRYRALGQTPWGTVYKYTSQVKAVTKAALATLAAQGAFTPGGHTIDADPGYRFTVTPNLDAGVIEVDIAVRPLQYARMVGFHLVHVPLHLPMDAATIRSLK